MKARKLYPEMLKIYKGKVGKLIPSGIFVSLPGFKMMAYIPKHHIKTYEVKLIENEVDMDQEVYLKVKYYYYLRSPRLNTTRIDTKGQ
jgi:ribosomal protein S1